MRTTKLLAALAGTALLAACTQEELVKVENAPQAMEEVVGTKLIGTDVSLNVTSDAQTRLAIVGSAAKWEKSDVIGVGWVAYGNPLEDDQASKGENGEIVPCEPDGHALYANHMFDWNEEAGRFTSKGNFYQGWHFAYYPWERMAKVGQKVFTVNPDQGKCEEGQDVRSLRASQALQISQRHFVDAVNEDNTLDVSFAVQPTTNMISVNTTPASSAFMKDGDKVGQLADKKISKVIIRINGEKAFAEELKLNAANIPAWDTAEGADNAKALREKLYAANSPILEVVGERLDTIDTDVTAAGYLVSDATQLNTIVAPYSWNVDWTTDEGKNAAREKVAIEVVLENESYFDIKYVTDATENSPASVNNAAIDKLIQAYAALKKPEDWNAGVLYGIFNYANGSYVNLNVQLYDAIFNTDATFNNIHDLKTWNDAVDMVEWLKRPAQEFIITGNVEFEDGEIRMPENGCVVTARRADYNDRMKEIFTLKNGEFATWPEKLITGDKVYVMVGSDATFSAAHLLPATYIKNEGKIVVPAGEWPEDEKSPIKTSVGNTGYTIDNYGTIEVEQYGELIGVNNYNRINLSWGGYVYLKGDKAGVIAYTVTQDDVDDPSRIIRLTAKYQDNGSQTDYAQVNTLVVNSGMDIDFTKLIEGEDTPAFRDPYKPLPSEPGVDDYTNFGDLSAVDFEINGGSIYSTRDKDDDGNPVVTAVNNVTMNGGNVGAKIEIKGALTIESGANIVNATDIAGALNITEGVGTITSAASIASVNIEAGNYTVNAQTIDGAVTATGENAFYVEVINGDVTINGKGEINDATINGDVTLNGDMLLNNVNVNGNLTVLGGKVKMADVNISGDLTNNGSVDVAGEAAAIGAIINNGNLTTYTDITVVSIVVNKNSTVTVADEKTIWYTTPKSEGGYIQKGTTTGEVKYKGADNVLEEFKAAFAEGGDVTLVADVELDEVLTIAEGKEVNLNLNGKTITVKGTSADPAFYTYKGSTLTITGNGTVEIQDPSVSLMFPGGDVVIENGTFVRKVPAGTPAKQVGAFIVGAKVSPWGSQTVTINGGYFDGGYYNADAADIDEILAGTKDFTETEDDIAKRGNSKDANKVRVAIKQNVQLNMNLSYNLLKIYGGTFVGFNPAWGDEGCMLPTTPNYLRPWSYYQGALLDGQTFNENGLVLPAGYDITKGATADGRPTYTVTYNK